LTQYGERKGDEEQWEVDGNILQISLFVRKPKNKREIKIKNKTNQLTTLSSVYLPYINNERKTKKGIRK